ncbi:hypothetical protein ACGE24_05940 [Corynebacterium kroppenstedtii]|uniref:DoxX family protein n=1 Tax=Corynebacterium sp. PCR 32 TaxID=3351342 RepID=UPI0030ABE986
MSSDKARWGLTALYTVSGCGHFVTPTLFEDIVPTYAPGTPRFWNYLAGAGELGTAALLAAPHTKANRFGGLMSAVLLIAVWPGNVESVRQRLDRPWPEQIGWIARLPLQVPMIRASWRMWRESPH